MLHEQQQQQQQQVRQVRVAARREGCVQCNWMVQMVFNTHAQWCKIFIKVLVKLALLLTVFLFTYPYLINVEYMPYKLDHGYTYYRSIIKDIDIDFVDFNKCIINIFEIFLAIKTKSSQQR